MGAVVAFFVLSAVVGRMCFVVRPFDSDGAMFVYEGKLTAEGGRIGCELIDNKFPTVGLITSAAWRVCGDYWPGYVILQMGLSLAGVYLLARSARRTIGEFSVLPTGLFALVYLNFNFAVRGGFQLETLQSFFSIVGAVAAVEAMVGDDARDSFLVGLAAGTAGMVKPSGLAVLAAFAVGIVWQKRQQIRRLWPHGLAAMLGLAIPAGVTVAYFQAAELWRYLPGIWRQIAGYAANSPWEAWDLSKPVIIALIVGFPMLVWGVIFRRDRHRVEVRPDRAIVVFAILWFAIECAGIVAQRRMYAYHFLVLAGPSALLFGLIPRKPRAIPLFAALIAPACFSIFGAGQVLAQAPESMGYTETEEYLASHARPGEAVWMDGYMRLLVVTDLRAGSRYPMTFLWANDDDAPLEYCRAMLRDFDERRPRYIAIPTDFQTYGGKLANRIKELGLRPRRKANFLEAWSELGNYVRANYVAETKADWETIYRRRGE
jgi:hypothetical protein